MKPYLIRLDAENLGQIIDALCVRQKAWQQTAMLLRGERPYDASACEDCDDLEEAEHLESRYTDLIETIVQQRRSQKLG
jgi:hypothetical protein